MSLMFFAAKTTNSHLACSYGNYRVMMNVSDLLLFLFVCMSDVSTYCRRCGLCGSFYTYQEWKERLHNFDDHVVMSIHLCLFLRNAIQVFHKFCLRHQHNPHLNKGDEFKKEAKNTFQKPLLRLCCTNYDNIYF